MSTEIASLYATIGADTSGFERGMKGVSSTLGGFGAALGGLATGALVVGTAAVAALGATIGSSVSKAAGFEQSLADIAASMGTTREAIAPLKSLIMDLSLDPTLKVNADEAASAVGNLVKNGLTMQEVLDGAAKSTVLLANATGADFGMAADIATDVMQQFNIGAGDMDKAVNGILGVTQASKFGIDGYKLAISQAGGVASSVGVSFDDFNAIIAATAYQFSSGGDAGTSLKTFLTTLVPQSNEASKAMKELGLITSDGANRFYDANGSMKSAADVAQILQDAFSGLSEEQQNTYAKTIFGNDAMRTAFALAKGGAQAINDLKTTIGKTDAESAAAERMNTLSGQWEIFRGIIDAARIQIGDAFMPTAKKLVEWASALAEKYMPMVVAWFQQFGAWLETQLPKIEAFALRLAEGARAFWSWATNGESAMSHLSDVAGLLWSKLSAAFSALWTWIKASAPQWWAALREWGRMAGAWIVDVGWPALKTNIVTWAANLWAWVKTNAPIWWENLREWGRMAGTWITEVGWPRLQQNLATWASNLWDWVKRMAPVFFQKLGEWTVALLAWAVDGLAHLLNGLADGVGKITTWISGGGANSIGSAVGSWARALWTWVKEKLWPKLGPELMDLGHALLNVFGSIAGLLLTAVWKLATSIVGWFVKGIASVWIGFVDWWTEKWNSLWNWFTGLGTRFSEWAGGIIDGFKQGLTDRWNGFVAWWKDKWDRLVNFIPDLLGIHSPSRVFYGYGEMIMKGMANGIDSGSRWVTGAMGDALALDGPMPGLAVAGAGGAAAGGPRTAITIQNLNVQSSGTGGGDLAQAVTFMSTMYGYGYN